MSGTPHALSNLLEAPALTSAFWFPIRSLFGKKGLSNTPPHLRFPVPNGKFSEPLGRSVIAHIEHCKLVKV